MTPELHTEEKREVIRIELQSVLKNLDKLYEDENEENRIFGYSLLGTRAAISKLEQRWAYLETQLPS